MPKFDNARTRFLSQGEAQKLISYLFESSQLWYDIALISLNTGMRLSEIIKLKVSNINLSSQYVSAMDTKNRKNRYIPLNNTAFEVFSRNTKGKENSDHVFLHENKKINIYNNVFTRAVKKCGFNNNITDNRQKVVFHTLRHTFASWLVQQGTPLAVVSSLLGHSSIQMTMRYAHLAPEQGQNAVMKMEQVNKISNYCAKREKINACATA